MNHKTPIKILLVDDEAEYCNKLAALFSYSDQVEVVGMAHSGEEAIEIIPECQPEIVLLDIEMPGIGGLATVEMIIASFPAVQPVVLSAFPHPEYVERALAAGAKGFLVKGSDMQELIGQLQAVQQGRIPLDTEPEQVLISNASKKIQAREAYPKFLEGISALAERHLALLPYLVRGKADKAIAKDLHLSVKTVRNYVREILVATACESRTEFAFKALSTGVVEVSTDLL